MKYNETFYFFLHRSFPLDDRFKSKGSKCPHCPSTETTHPHLFTKCPLATNLLYKTVPSLHYSKALDFIFSGGLKGTRKPLNHRLWIHAVWKAYAKEKFK